MNFFLYLQLKHEIPSKTMSIRQFQDYTYMVYSDSLRPSRIGLAGIDKRMRKTEVLFFGQKYFRWNP